MKTPNILRAAFVLIVALLLTSCRKEVKTVASDPPPTGEVPVLPKTPYDYTLSPNDNIAMLGRVLFYDKRLSANNNISCGSCHKQDHAFADVGRFSEGTDHKFGDRNTPSIFPKMGRLFWDGRSFSLQDLALRPIRNQVEMNIPDINNLVKKISSLYYYPDLFKKAFPYSSTIDSGMIKMALADFLKNFDFSDTKFNQTQRGLGQLSISEQTGRDIFFGKGQCSQCHHIEKNFSNTGYGNTDESHNIGLDSVYTDPGVRKITGNMHDEGSFMMPVLLNVEFTAPYMHDGRFATLEEVVEHYNSKIKNHPNLDIRLRANGNMASPPLRMLLTDNEKKGLVDFLKTLSDPNILKDEKFSDPFVALAK